MPRIAEHPEAGQAPVRNGPDHFPAPAENQENPLNPEKVASSQDLTPFYNNKTLSRRERAG